MQNQKIVPKSTCIPHKHLEMLMSGKLTPTASRVYLALARIQFGWHKPGVSQKLRKISEMTGIVIPHISRALGELKDKKIVTNSGNNRSRVYRIVTKSDKINVTNSDNIKSCNCKLEAENGKLKENKIKKVYINPPTPHKKPAGNLGGRLEYKDQKPIEPKYIAFVRDKVEEDARLKGKIGDIEAVIQYRITKGTHREEFLDFTKMDRYYKKLENKRLKYEQEQNEIDIQDYVKDHTREKNLWIKTIWIKGYPALIVPKSRWEFFKIDFNLDAKALSRFKYHEMHSGYMIDN